MVLVMTHSVIAAIGSSTQVFISQTILKRGRELDLTKIFPSQLRCFLHYSGRKTHQAWYIYKDSIFDSRGAWPQTVIRRQIFLGKYLYFLPLLLYFSLFICIDHCWRRTLSIWTFGLTCLLTFWYRKRSSKRHDARHCCFGFHKLKYW